MSSTREASESAQLNIRDDKYVADKKLVTIPERWDSPFNLQEPCHSVPTPFPSLKTFVHLASVAYIDHEDDGSFKSTSTDDEEVQLDGFTFLSAAKNSDRLNGYYAVAYVNRDTRQVILSHRGTNPSTLGALWADLKGIVMNSGVPQVSSAMTFAHKVVDYAERRGYEVFFTGHSLGGWLAQITTFSTIYLTLNEVTGHFVGKQSPHSDVRMPYTVVFDSPGAYEFLFSLKKALFPRHVESTQEIGIEALPVEVYLFHPNPINCVNFQIGRLFILDLEKVGVDTGKYFGAGTHGIGPVVRLLNNWGEDNAVKGRVIDFREGKKDFDSKDGSDRTVPWNKSSVPLYFFSRDERGFLEGAKRDFPPEGQFEGVSWEDEKIANKLISLERGDFRWQFTGWKESVVNCGELDRREFIPRVRHIVRCLRLRGTLWWNPKKSQLPSNYVERWIAPSNKKLSAPEVLNEANTLLLLVDPPGMGKSSAMTKLEMELRSEISSCPRIIVRLNLNQVQDILESHPDNGTTGSTKETEYVMNFLEKFVKYIPMTLLKQSLHLYASPVPIYILLDGLDEVCPIYEQIMLHILRNLLFKTQRSLSSVHKVILTMRPHLRLLIEDNFSVEANSLRPFNLNEQTEFLQKEVGPTIDAEKCLNSLPEPAQSLMENPLMLSLYAEVLKSDGADGVLNLFDLYSQFMKAKHKLHLVEKEKREPADQSTKQRAVSMLEDNLKFYYACAVNELIGPLRTRTSWFMRFLKKHSDFGEELLEQPQGRKLDELISFGVVVGEGRFKHRSFAEFYFATLVADEERTSKTLRDVLLGRMYECGGFFNIELFIRDILIQKTAERTTMPSKWHSPSSVALLRESEASMYLGEKRLRRLVKGWLDSIRFKTESLPTLFRIMMSPHVSKVKLRNEGYFPWDLNRTSLLIVRAEVSGAKNKTDTLINFYNGVLFPFLCGWSVLMCLDYSDPNILRIIRDETRRTGYFAGWLCGLADRDWVRRSVFHMHKQTKDNCLSHGHLIGDIAELILLIAMRTDDISKILLTEEISAALKSVDSGVSKALRMDSVDTNRVREVLETYVEIQTIKHLLLHFLTKTVRSEWDNVLFTFEMSWWVSEVFSRTELLSILTDEATRGTDVAGIYQKMVQLAWGEEFTHHRIHFLQFKIRSRETPLTVTNTPVWKILVSLMPKKNSMLQLDTKTVARIFIGLIETSTCCELLGVLKQFQTLVFIPELLRGVLMSKNVLEFIKSQWNHFNGGCKPSCKTVAVMRYYLFAYGENFLWVKCFSKLNAIPVEVLQAFENVERTPVEIFQPFTKEPRLALVTQLGEMFTDDYNILQRCETLSDFVECYSYDKEPEWEWLLQARQLIPPQPSGDTVGYVDHGRVKRTQNIVSLIRVWVKHFGVEETRRAADEQNLWTWNELLENIPTGEFLLAAVEVGSLRGVKTLAWPGLLRWKNERGTTAGDVALEIWGCDHEVSKFLEERFKAARIFQD